MKFEIEVGKGDDEAREITMSSAPGYGTTVVIDGHPKCLLSKVGASDAVDYFPLEDLVRCIINKYDVDTLLSELREEAILEYVKTIDP